VDINALIASNFPASHVLLVPSPESITPTSRLMGLSGYPGTTDAILLALSLSAWRIFDGTRQVPRSGGSHD
jgi:hypothetical protein